jgi:hypothetical protein
MSAIQKMMGLVKDRVAPKEVPLERAKVFVMLALIHSDGKADKTREMGLLAAFCAFDHRLAALDLEAVKREYEGFRGRALELFDLLADSIPDRRTRVEVYASAHMLAGIDGSVSGDEAALLSELGDRLRLTMEDLEMIRGHSRYILETMRELNILTY